MTIERKNIHLLTDFGFKRIFGTEEHKKNLIRFLNAFLKEHTGTITDITYLPTEQLGVAEDEKRLVFDVFCSTQKDDHIIVEMQRATQEFFRKRIVAYSARTISNLLRKGDREYDYPKVISILLADFHLPDLREDDTFMQYVTLKDDKNRIFLDRMAFVLIYLTKFAAPRKFEQFADERQKWCYAIKNMWRLSDGDIPPGDIPFHELYEECKVKNLNDMEKQEYEKSILEYEDVQEALAYQRKLGKDEGFNDGYEKGMEKGMKKGREETLLQTAKRLLEMGFSLSDVAKATGLSEGELLG